MWLRFFKDCIVSLIFLGVNSLSLSTTFFWSQLKLWFASLFQFLPDFFMILNVILKTICAKVGLAFQNFKPPKDNISKNELKALKELQSDTSIVILPADKRRSNVIFNWEDCMEKWMNHVSNGPYQLLKQRSYYQNES